MLSENLARLEQANANDLVDILNIQIAGDSFYERLESFVRQVGDPYHFKVAQTPVRICFCPSGGQLADKLTRHFLSLKYNS